MIGTLAYADVYGAPDARLLDDEGSLAVIVSDACARGRATVLRVLKHRFVPQGVTVVALLAESHAAVHTYPEDRSYMVDVFTCGTTADAAGIAYEIVMILGGTGTVRVVDRGDNARRQTDQADKKTA